MCERLDISIAERQTRFRGVRFFNHAWDDPQALRDIGAIPSEEIHALSGGLFAMDVSVEVNRRLFDYDQIVIAVRSFRTKSKRILRRQQVPVPWRSGPRILNSSTGLGR